MTSTQNDLGIIRFSDMIPVPQECVYLLDLKSKMAKFYKDLSCDFKLLEEKSIEYKN